MTDQRPSRTQSEAPVMKLLAMIDQRERTTTWPRWIYEYPANGDSVLRSPLPHKMVPGIMNLRMMMEYIQSMMDALRLPRANVRGATPLITVFVHRGVGQTQQRKRSMALFSQMFEFVNTEHGVILTPAPYSVVGLPRISL